MERMFRYVPVFLFCLAFLASCQNIKSSLVKTDSSAKSGLDKTDKSVDANSAVTEKVKRDSLSKSLSLLPDSAGKSASSNILQGAYSASPVVDDPQKILDQYVDMDRLGNAVLFEIDLAEKKWAAIRKQYLQASSLEQEKLKVQLEKADSDRLILYRAYTRIYRDGRTDWPTVQRDVERILNSLKGK